MKKIISISIWIISLIITISLNSLSSWANNEKININFYNLQPEGEANLYYSRIIPYNLIKELKQSEKFNINQINRSIDPATVANEDPSGIEYIISGTYSISEKLLTIKLTIFDVKKNTSTEIVKETEKTIIISKDLINDLRVKVENYINNVPLQSTQEIEPETTEKQPIEDNQIAEEPVEEEAQPEEAPQPFEETSEESTSSDSSGTFEDESDNYDYDSPKDKFLTLGLRGGYSLIYRDFSDSYNSTFIVNPYAIYFLPSRLLPPKIGPLGVGVNLDYLSTSGDGVKESNGSYSTFTMFGLNFSAIYLYQLNAKLSFSFGGGFGIAKTTFKYTPPKDGQVYATSSIEDNSTTSSINLEASANYNITEQITISAGPSIKRIFYSKTKDIYLYNILIGVGYNF